MLHRIGSTLHRLSMVCAVSAAFAVLSGGTAVASNPVIDASGTGYANCTGAVVTHMNAGSSSSTFELNVGKSEVVQRTLPAGKKSMTVLHGVSGEHWSLWGPADAKLASGTIPAQCPGGSPRAFIMIDSSCVAHYFLDTHDRVKGPKGDVAFLLTHGKKSFNVPLSRQKATQPDAEVTRQLKPGQWARAEVLGHLADAQQAPPVCAPSRSS